LDEYSLSYVEGRERLFPLSFLVFVLALSGKAWFECVVWSGCDRTELELGWASKMRGLETFVSFYWRFVLCFCVLFAVDRIFPPVLTGLLVCSGVSGFEEFLFLVGQVVEGPGVLGIPTIFCGPGVMLGLGGLGCV
jgi:hypothetical protein